MTCVVAVGMQYGDEGKGKIVDFLADKADYVVRYAGGNNAGHTLVINGQQTILHFIPSGVFHGKACVMGNGMVIDLDKLEEEIKDVESKGIEVRNNLLISGNAHLILPDNVEDSKKDTTGSTGRGIGPTYSNKHAYEGLRVRDLINVDSEIDERDLKARTRLEKYKDYLRTHSDFKKSVVDCSVLLDKAINEGKNILFEGAQGVGLDVDHGHYPFITGSNASSGGACTGTGVGPTKIDKVVGISKAYVTRVDRDGSSPLTTQLDDEIGQQIRDKGKEYGATTGRPRRCGWFDVVLAKHSVRVCGLSGVIITKLDVLDGLKEVKICTHYELDGERIEEFPTDAITQRRCKPVYEILPGWENTRDAKTFEDLPGEAKNFVKRIEELLGVPVVMVANGPGREEIIVREEVW